MSLEEDDIIDGNVRFKSYHGVVYPWYTYGETVNFYYGSNVTHTANGKFNFSESDTNYTMFDMFDITMKDGTRLIDKNCGYDLELTGIKSYIKIYQNSNNALVYTSTFNPSYFFSIGVDYYDKIGNFIGSDSLYNFEVVSNTYDTYNIRFNVDGSNIKKDCYRMQFSIRYNGKLAHGIPDTYMDSSLYRIDKVYGVSGSEFAMNVDESNVGFFKSIILWLTNIRDNLVNGFSDLKNGLSNIVSAITNLPIKIWNAIETGLKNLFIPSEKDITDMKDKWDMLLADRFGAVYESGALITDFAGNFTEQGTQDTISMPAVTVNLAGADFTFGGYDVDIVPDGFGFLVEILKGVIDIVCTIAFVNSMKEKYDRLVSQ